MNNLIGAGYFPFLEVYSAVATPEYGEVFSPHLLEGIESHWSRGNKEPGYEARFKLTSGNLQARPSLATIKN